ncbi:hypothetical protein GTP38_17705 [Duganella sp. FT94W]|uniref:Glycosyltransferase n=1 Tax=Duganella lactea TaxID=2692173 RepID=A0ABW9V9G6_9BURK|nr:glycosyltransferase family 4 protein [Duganella lactea]MYM36170.1 hypothetical protein [Duganella lactea]
MKKIYYFSHINNEMNDGGQSRNKAFTQAFDAIGAVKINVYSSNNFMRFVYLINCLRIFLLSKNNRIFIHQGTIITLFPLSIIKYRFPFWLAFSILRKAIGSNSVTIEVNDLPYEQSIDLELSVSKVTKLFQDKLYGFRDAKYVFASHRMAEYIRTKSKINCDVVINGSNELTNATVDLASDILASPARKFIYAGGLSKGRQIEELVSSFKGKKSLLVLIGESGQWLKEINLPENIFYLGEFPESQAQAIVSKCDCGIIPYDANRFYYNICYPTKASFYIASGIPFLSTPLLELMDIFEGSGMAYFLPINEWGTFIDDSNEIDFQKSKVSVGTRKHEFYWKRILSHYVEKIYFAN